MCPMFEKAAFLFILSLFLSVVVQFFTNHRPPAIGTLHISARHTWLMDNAHIASKTDAIPTGAVGSSVISPPSAALTYGTYRS